MSRLSWNVQTSQPIFPPPKITINPTCEEATIMRAALHCYLREQERNSPAANEFIAKIKSITSEFDDLVRCA